MFEVCVRAMRSRKLNSIASKTGITMSYSLYNSTSATFISFRNPFNIEISWEPVRKATTKVGNTKTYPPGPGLIWNWFQSIFHSSGHSGHFSVFRGKLYDTLLREITPAFLFTLTYSPFIQKHKVWIKD
jgi:hypothetical protein